MNIVERQIRELALLGVERFRIWTSPSSAQGVPNWRADLHRLYEIDLTIVEASSDSDLGRDLAQVDGCVVLLEGDVVHDDRILDQLLESGPGSRVTGRSGETAIYLDPRQAGELCARISSPDAGRPGSLEEALRLEGEELHTITARDIGHYVPALRLTMEPVMARVRSPEDLAPLSKLMYRRTFKGVIDAVARYGYYHLVRVVTSPLSRTSVPPNLLTVFSIVGIWAAIPSFAFGYLAVGISCAWAGVLLDSIDGKLARLRLHLSEKMGAIEHITAAPGLALWYAAFGWHLSNLDSARADEVLYWTGIGIAAFLLDKVVSGSFKKLFGKEIFDFSAGDARFHLFAARRNITLLLLTIGALTGEPGIAFQVAVAWMVLTFSYHLLRFARVARGARSAGQYC